MSKNEMDNYLDYVKLREQGKKYREIAEIKGVSFQRAHQIVNKSKDRYKYHTHYPNFNEWLFCNGVSVSKLCGILYNYHQSSCRTNLRNWLAGKTDTHKLSIQSIKKLLKETGMTFEELFDEM